MSNKCWFKDEGIIAQEASLISDGDNECCGLAIVVGGTEVLLELDELKGVILFLESEYNE